MTAAAMAPEPGRVVLHLDIDAFFCQVEEKKHGVTPGTPVAIQQHQDIIAANYPARAAGVQKHMRPAEARRILHAAGGRILPVHMEAGQRVSYGPYRAVSRAMIKLLNRFEEVEVVEKASIDEAFLQLKPRQPGSADRPLDDHSRAVAASIRAAVKRDLGLDSSVGIAPNKLLAKLASGVAKPNGMCTVLSAAEVDALLARLPAARMPGCGGKIGNTFTGAGINSIKDLQAWSEADMRTALGFPADVASKLHRWARGRDDAPVAPRPPPKTLSVQMSLTPEALPMHPSQVGQPAVASDSTEMLHPLPVGAPDYRRRVGSVIAAMGADVLGRVLVDREDEGRWPATLTLQLRFMGGGADNSRFYARSTAFPAPSLAGVPPPAGPAATDAQGAHSGQVQQRNESRSHITSAPHRQHAGSSSQVQQPRRPPAAAARLGRQQQPSPGFPAAPGSHTASADVHGDTQAAADRISSAGGAATPAHLTDHRASGRAIGARGSNLATTILGANHGAAMLEHLTEHRASGRAVGSPPQDALEAALRGNAEALCRSASALQPPAAVLVEVRLLATGFTTAGTAAGPSIRQFLAQQPAAKRQRTAKTGSNGGHSGSAASAAIDRLSNAAAARGGIAGTPLAAERIEASRIASSAVVGSAADVPAKRAAYKTYEADADSYNGSASPVSTLTPPEDASELVSMPRSQPQQMPACWQPESSTTSNVHASAAAAAPVSEAGTAARNAAAAPKSEAAAAVDVADVDLSAVDTEEQRRILQQLQWRRRPGSAAAPAGGGRGGRPRQQGIAEAFRRHRQVS